MTWQPIAKDIFSAVKLTTSTQAKSLLKTWLAIPLGLSAMLTACFGIDALFRRLSVAFPASVACLVLLFLGLLVAEKVVGGSAVRRVVGVLDVPAGWSLRWINVFFTPAFVTLPLSPPISIKEVFTIIAIFIIGFLIMMALAAYLTRSIQLLVGSSKRAETQRAEELHRGSRQDVCLNGPGWGDEHYSSTLGGGSRATSVSQAESSVPLRSIGSRAAADGEEDGDGDETPQSPPQLRLQNHHHSPNEPARDIPQAATEPEYPPQTPLPPSRADRWAAVLTANLDASLFVALLLFVGLPVYYAAGYAMPLHLSISVLAYFAASALPLSWKQYLHPVLVSSLATVLTIWPLAKIHGDSLTTALRSFKTGSNYLTLWHDSIAHESSTLPPPGAGDVFATILDASIVSLALPMFQYRRELRAHYLSIAAPNVLISVASLFAYPPLCFALGISAERSLAFSSRSLTLALATPATLNLGGDVNTVAALAIVSGILGVLVGQRILGWLRIPEDDYVTRGVTLGINSSAIATALLLRTDPRAAALSSLSMSLFGTVTVLFTSIPPIVAIVRSLVGL